MDPEYIYISGIRCGQSDTILIHRGFHILVAYIESNVALLILEGKTHKYNGQNIEDFVLIIARFKAYWGKI